MSNLAKYKLCGDRKIGGVDMSILKMVGTEELMKDYVPLQCPENAPPFYGLV